MKIYLASGFFTPLTRERVKIIAKELRLHGFEVFVPMEHEIPNAWDKSNAEWAEEVFNADVKAINEADMVIACDDGMTGDCGTAWEIGYCYGIKKPCFLIPCGKDISLMVYNGRYSPDRHIQEAMEIFAFIYNNNNLGISITFPIIQG